MELRLIKPAHKYFKSFRNGVKDSYLSLISPSRYIGEMRSAARGRTKRGAVPRTEYWLVNGKQYLGRIQIRYRPSGRHNSIKSHVYYEIRPSMRGKGYGHLILKLGLTKARSTGLRRLTIACDESNIASRNIIERNGGVLLRKARVPGEVGAMRVYKIDAADSRVAS